MSGKDFPSFVASCSNTSNRFINLSVAAARACSQSTPARRQVFTAESRRSPAYSNTESLSSACMAFNSSTTSSPIFSEAESEDKKSIPLFAARLPTF